MLLSKEHLDLVDYVALECLEGQIKDRDDRLEKVKSELVSLSETQKYLFRELVGTITNGVFGCRAYDDWYDVGFNSYWWFHLNAICLPRKEHWAKCKKEIWNDENPGIPMPYSLQWAYKDYLYFTEKKLNDSQKS